MPKRTHEEALQTKKQIMDAAVTLFSSKGYEKTSLSDVARAAGVTRGAIYWHFENKGELLIELLQAIAKDKNLVEPLLDSAKESEFDPLGCIRKWLYAHGTNEANLFCFRLVNETYLNLSFTSSNLVISSLIVLLSPVNEIINKTSPF